MRRIVQRTGAPPSSKAGIGKGEGKGMGKGEDKGMGKARRRQPSTIT